MKFWLVAIMLISMSPSLAVAWAVNSECLAGLTAVGVGIDVNGLDLPQGGITIAALRRRVERELRDFQVPVVQPSEMNESAGYLALSISCRHIPGCRTMAFVLSLDLLQEVATYDRKKVVAVTWHLESGLLSSFSIKEDETNERVQRPVRHFGSAYKDYHYR
jgi:hypothetical protein